nr:uncharacterized protein LOC128697698 [Cherax quadricarinatus]
MYCTRDFDDERVLILHQRARHFKCGNCQKKLYTGPGLAFHCLQVHKEIIYTVPNALEKKNYITFEIYGMNGIPSEEEVEVAAKQLKNVMAAVSSSGAMQPVSNPLFPSAAQATIVHLPVDRLQKRDLTWPDHGSYQPAAAGGPGPRGEFSPTRSLPMLDEWQLPKRYRERISEESEYINPPGRAPERMWQSGWSGRSARLLGRQVEQEDNFDRSQGLTEYILHNMPTEPDPSEEQAWQNMPDRTHPAEDWIRQDTSDRTRLAEEQIGQNMYGKRRRLEEHWMRPDTSGRTHMAGDWVRPDTSSRTRMREDWVRPDTSGRTPMREDWIRPDTSGRTHTREWIRPNTSDRTYMREDWISPDISDSTHMREDWISPDTSDSTHMREDWIRRDISRRTQTEEDWIRPGTSDGTHMEEDWIRPNTSDRQTSLPEDWARQNPSDRGISQAKRWNRQNIADRIHLADEQGRQSMVKGTHLPHGMHLTEQVWQNISEKIRLAKEQVKQDMADRINHEEQVWSDRTAPAEEQVGYNMYGRRTGLAEQVKQNMFDRQNLTEQQGWQTMSDRLDHAEWQDLPGGRDFLAEQSWQENSSGRTHLLQERVWEAIWSSINEGLVGEEAQQMSRSGKMHLAQQIWQEVWYSMEGLAEEESWQDTSEEHFLQHRPGQRAFQAGAQGRQNNRFNRKPYFSGGQIRQNKPMKNASLR